MPIYTLNHLEQIKARSSKTRQYIAMRAVEVQQWINRLTAFAKLKPNSKPGLHCARKAKELQYRLDRVTEGQEAEPFRKERNA